GIAFGMPIDDAVKAVHELADSLNAAAQKSPAPSLGFGRKVAAVVKARIAAKNRSRFSANADDESFAEQIKEAVKKKSSQEPQKQQVQPARKRNRDRRVIPPPPDT